jgi:dolichol-phosphate mannosyltransferase
MISIVIPCHNEADNAPMVESGLLPIAATLATRTPVEIIFVDDGSTDDTRAAYQALGERVTQPDVRAFVVAHDRNRGLGAALATGFQASHGDIIITTDCDGTYRFTEIPGLLACLTDTVDVVTASPYHPDGGVENVPGYRLVLSRGSSWIYRRLVDRKVHTYTALFRVYRRRVLERVLFSSSGFLAGTEILVNAMLAGFRVAEYPAVLHARVMGVSKAKLARTIRAHLSFQASILYAQIGRRNIRWVVERPDLAHLAVLPPRAVPTRPGDAALAAREQG